MSKKIILVLSTLILAVFLLTTVNADFKHFCLSNGQTIEFSKCNPSMEDYTCTGTSCQVCTNRISAGIYCPVSPNACDTSCEPFNTSISTNNTNSSGGSGDTVDDSIVTLISPVNN